MYFQRIPYGINAMLSSIRCCISVMSYKTTRSLVSVSQAGPLKSYLDLISQGKLQFDPRQKQVAVLLQTLYDDLIPYYERSSTTDTLTRTDSNWLAKYSTLFGFALPHEQHSLVSQPPKSIYLWGGTGSGKTHLMNVFYDSLPFQMKRRIHFNNFMINVHKRLYALSKEPRMKNRNVMQALCEELTSEFRIICFDEFQVTDVADAMILKSLFSSLHSAGVVIVSTSNRPPKDLYKDGLQRNLFVPFIDFILSDFIVHDMDSETDYRKLAEQQVVGFRSYFVPLSSASSTDTLRAFKSLGVGGQEPWPLELTVFSRTLLVKQVLVSQSGQKVAMFSFVDLCAANLGPADYIHIAETFRGIVITNVPCFTLSDRNELRRFITLIDCLYEERVLLIIQAESTPADLLDLTDDERRSSNYEEIFAFDRCISRLVEMQSHAYIEAQLSKLNRENRPKNR